MKNIFMGFVLLLATSAFGAVGSEAKTTDMFAPKGGSSEFLAGLALLTGKDEVGSSSNKYSGFALAAQYAYGFSDSASLYVTQTYSAWEVEPSYGGTIKIKGLGDTKIGLKAVIDFVPAFFYYDVGYQMALLEKSKRDNSGDYTAGSTRPQLNLQVGVGSIYEVIGYGAKLNFNFYQDGDFDNQNITEKYKSGTGMGWKIYAQYQSSSKVGASYAEQLVDSYDIYSTKQPKSFSRVYAVYGIVPVSTTSEVFIDVQKPESGIPSVTYGQYNVAGTFRTTF